VSAHRPHRPGRPAASSDGDAFDELLPAEWRARAAVHFTPAAVAERAARWLVDRPGAWILDVGAGVGKFCVVAGAAHPEATFVGVEQRPHLARVALAITLELQLPNVRFIHGDLVDVDWDTFDGFYLYNPFAEHLRDNRPILDRTIELDPAFYLFYVGFVRDRLARARVGTRVVTYHGFGGALPPDYERLRVEDTGTGPLELWVKQRGALRRGGRRDSWDGHQAC
jgi:predicted RNA methylase